MGINKEQKKIRVILELTESDHAALQEMMSEAGFTTTASLMRRILFDLGRSAIHARLAGNEIGEMNPERKRNTVYAIPWLIGIAKRRQVPASES